MAVTSKVCNNRELALLIWILVLLIVSFLTNIRKDFIPIIKILTKRIFLIIYFLICLYLFGVISIFDFLHIWKASNIKDVVFWLFTVGFVLVFKINEAKSNDYFKGIMRSSIKWTVILEFILNLYSFSLITELIILPILSITVASQAYAENYDEHQRVAKFLRKLIGIVTILVFTYSIYKSILNFSDVITFQTITSLLLPSTITIMYIPFVYLLALFSSYESFLTHLNVMTVKKEKVKEIKPLILKTANFKLEKLLRIQKNFNKRVFYDEANLKDYIQEIGKKSYIKI